MAGSSAPSKTEALLTGTVAALIEAIEAGAGDWEMPWHRVGPGGLCPVNAATGRPYRGGNRWSLALAAMEHGLEGGSWATYRQWASIGAQVRRGERALAVIMVPRQHTRTRTDEATGEETDRTWTTYRSTVVFHASQVDGWEPAGPALTSHEPIDAAEQLAAQWADAGMVIVEGGNEAYYQRTNDTVHVPGRAQFANIEHFYSTLAHEATHWTGHPDRLARAYGARFGDQAYAVEELTAELGAAVIGATIGISHATRDDHAAYLAHWVQVLRQDPTHLWVIAGAAETAADYLLGAAQ